MQAQNVIAEIDRQTAGQVQYHKDLCCVVTASLAFQHACDPLPGVHGSLRPQVRSAGAVVCLPGMAVCSGLQLPRLAVALADPGKVCDPGTAKHMNAMPSRQWCKRRGEIAHASAA